MAKKKGRKSKSGGKKKAPQRTPQGVTEAVRHSSEPAAAAPPLEPAVRAEPPPFVEPAAVPEPVPASPSPAPAATAPRPARETITTTSRASAPAPTSQPLPFHKKFTGEIVLGLLVAYVVLLVFATISELFDLGWFRFDWLIR